MKESGESAPQAANLSRLLVVIANDRDQDAFARLFEHFTPRLKTYFLRRGVPGGQAEDLAQETMLLVWRKAVSFDPSLGSASSWIFTIARNLRVDALRRERQFATADTEPPIPQHEPSNPEQALIDGDNINQLHRALGDLPEDAMRVVRLVYLEERSPKLITGEMGVPFNTLKSRVYRTLRRLRASIGDLR